VKRLSWALTRGDSVVLLLALFLLVMLYVQFWQKGGQGAEARVMVDGKVWARLNLFENRDLHVPGSLGESHIQVRDGQIRFIASPCVNKVCVHSGWLSEGGDVAVCLPNRVSLQILGSDPRFDAINF
jgi:hypothetical protein